MADVAIVRGVHCNPVLSVARFFLGFGGFLANGTSNPRQREYCRRFCPFLLSFFNSDHQPPQNHWKGGNVQARLCRVSRVQIEYQACM